MNSKKYLDKMNTSYHEYRETWETLQGRLASVKEKQVEVKKSDETSLRKAADIEDLQAQAREINKELSELQQTALAEFEQIEADYNNDISEHFTVNTEDVDNAATMLLNSGAMTDSDLYALANQFNSNMTMLKLIDAEAGKRDSHEARALKASIDAFTNTSERKDTFDGALNNLYNSLNSNRGLADPSAEYWENELYRKVSDEITALETFKI